MVAAGLFWDFIDATMDLNSFISHVVSLVEMVACFFNWFVYSLDNLCRLVRKTSKQGYSTGIPITGIELCHLFTDDGDVHHTQKKEVMVLIENYFPQLNPIQKHAFDALGPVYREWNEKINVISRKDIDHLYEHHVLHSLALAKYNPFHDGMNVIDVGTGGGFPGIPLAIMFPSTNFILLDSTAKKIHVVQEIATALKLENVITVHSRVEHHQGRYDLILSRAVSTLQQMVIWTNHLTTQNRWIFLKGGSQKDLRKELPPLYKIVFTPVSEYFPGDYFKEKWIVDVQRTN